MALSKAQSAEASPGKAGDMSLRPVEGRALRPRALGPRVACEESKEGMEFYGSLAGAAVV